MTADSPLVGAPALVWLCTLMLLVAPVVAAQKDRQWFSVLLLVVLGAVALGSSNGGIAYGTLAVITSLHAAAAARTSRTSMLSMGVAALACGVAAGALWMEQPHIAFGASIVATSLRCGLFPLHGGIASLCDKLPSVQAQQLATLPILVFAHLRFVDHTNVAFDAAIPLVVIGAASMLAFGFVSLVQRDLGGLFRASTLMHGGMLLAAVGAAGRGHYAAALIVAITMALALNGFSVMLSALEARSGSIASLLGGGRARAFPRMAASLLFFGGAAVGLPGTSGFIADDLLLHALWGESVGSAVMMILASALLAVAILAGFARTFLGKPVRQLAPDLLPTERFAVLGLVVMLIVLGLVPSLLMDPTKTVLG